MITEQLNWVHPDSLNLPPQTPGISTPVIIEPVQDPGSGPKALFAYYTLDSTGNDLSWQPLGGDYLTTSQVRWWCFAPVGPSNLLQATG